MRTVSGVYIITCMATGEQYVGSSYDIYYRWKRHRAALNSGKHINSKLAQRWEEYGQEQFKFEVFEECPREKLLEREQFWIYNLEPKLNIATEVGYPTTRGIKRDEQWLSNMSKGIKRYYESLSDEEKAARAKSASHPHNEETKQVLSERTRQAYADGKLSRIRGPRSEETKAKLRAAALKQFEHQRIEREQKQAEFDAGREEREQGRRRKISQAHTGKVQTEETRAKLRAANQKQFADEEKRQRHAEAVKAAMTPEVIEKLRLAKLGKKQDPEHIAARAAKRVGTQHSPETIEKMREARRQYWQRKKQKP